MYTSIYRSIYLEFKFKMTFWFWISLNEFLQLQNFCLLFASSIQIQELNWNYKFLFKFWIVHNCSLSEQSD